LCRETCQSLAIKPFTRPRQLQATSQWQLHADQLLGTKVPPTLTGVLQARLDGLPAAEKLALQQASVIGAVFWDRALNWKSRPLC